jgi:hypothetical protein
MTAISVGQVDRKLAQMLVDLDAEATKNTHLDAFKNGPFRAFRLDRPRTESPAYAVDTERLFQLESTASDEYVGDVDPDFWPEEFDQVLGSCDLTIAGKDISFLGVFSPQQVGPRSVMTL